MSHTAALWGDDTGNSSESPEKVSNKKAIIWKQNMRLYPLILTVFSSG
ncbi:MAG: hypothetical protein F6K55_43600 [Moorea sp. SIO4A3]|nr:hypothetical protein [Moorena sp. SIO4A3]